MKRNRMSKLSVSLIVLAMAMSALVLLPSDGGTGQTVKTNVIEVPVQDTDGYFVSSATVDLTNVHTGAVKRANPTTPGLYHADDVPAGIYRVDVVAGEYYDNHTVIVNFTAYTSMVTPTVKLQTFGPKSHVWSVNVKSAASGGNIQGATVGFYNCDRNETVASALTDASGNANVSMFATPPTETFALYVKASRYNTTYEELTVSGPGSRNFVLAASKRVSGVVRNWEGTTTLKNVVGYMLSKDTSLPLIARMPQSPASDGSFEFDAFPGQFIMVVDADNGSAYVQEIAISASGSYSFDDFRLEYQEQRTEQVSVAFGADYQSFDLGVTTTWSYDETHPALLYSNMGSLRLQIDLALGDGDGTLISSEINRFTDLLTSIGSQYVTSSGLLKVNGSYYDPGAVTGFNMVLAPGSVVSDVGVQYSYNCAYTPHTAVPIGGSYYDVDFTAKYDVYEVNYVYTVVPATGYELVHNESNSLVSVSGYLSVTVQPVFVAAGGSQDITLKFEESLSPVAKAGIRDDAYTHAVYVDQNVSRYLVKVNENATFTTIGSEDPNQNPLKYMWNFGDGVFVNTSDATVVHKFTTIARFTVNLTVMDVADLPGWSEIVVDCDGLVPHAEITVKDKTKVSNSVSVEQRETVWFNATGSYDDAVTAGDHAGIVDFVQFDWGDGNHSSVIQGTANQQNVSWTWQQSGTYTVVLNVTDVVGQLASTTLTVVVNDTEAPVVSITVMNETWQSTYIENQTLYFDATKTTDNVNKDLADLNFSWDFADGTWINQTGTAGANVTHVFASTGDFNIALNVTDKTGNYKVERRLITVLSGPRPNLWIERVYYDPQNFTEGKSGFILVNITNKGSENAENVQVNFYIVLGDGTQKAISGTGTLWVNDSQVSVIEPGQKAQYRLSYSPGSKGTFIIRVNVTCDDQLRPYSFTARDDDAMHVNEAAWRQWLLWGGVIVIIVLIPLLLMLRGRLAKREKKGPRRERKEKEKVSEEEL